MVKAFRKYLNAALVGFIVTFLVYLYWKLDRSEITTGVAIAFAGAVVALAAYIYLDNRFGRESELYDREGNLVDRDGKVLRDRSQL
jgi:hypothetical protein